MTKSRQETVYLKAERNVEVQEPEVTLGDVIQILCGDPGMAERIRQILLLKFAPGKRGQDRVVVSILRVVECIQELYPQAEIQNLGEPDFIVTYEPRKDTGSFFHGLKVAVVALCSFTGAAFSVMAFNNDVDVTKLFGQIYQLVTGARSDGFTILELTYSIGMVIGILVFFDHFGKKRFSAEPTPLEVEMRLYEKDIQTTLIDNSSRKGSELDVGDVPPGPSGSSGS